MDDSAENARDVTLHNGVTMPNLAFGCAFGDWVGTTELQGFLPEQAWRAVSLALDNGYQAFDGARAYGTGRIVGALLGQRFASGELFITTKLAHAATPPHINISHRRTWVSDKVAMPRKHGAPEMGAPSFASCSDTISRTTGWWSRSWLHHRLLRASV